MAGAFVLSCAFPQAAPHIFCHAFRHALGGMLMVFIALTFLSSVASAQPDNRVSGQNANGQNANEMSGAESKTGKKQGQQADPGPANDKRDLANQYYELNPTWQIASMAIRARAANLPAKRRLVFITAMERLLDKERLRQESIDLMVELYTEKELKALVKYYSDPLIQSALTKQETFERKIGPLVNEILDKALMEHRIGENPKDN